MKFVRLKNKAGEELSTKDDVPMYDALLTPLTEFIPQAGSIKEEEYTYEDNGVMKKGKNYTLRVRARDREGNVIEHPATGDKDIYVKLTGTQAKMIRGKADQDNIDIRTKVFKAYSYKNEYGEHVGVGYSRGAGATPITFDEFDSDMKSEGSQEKRQKENEEIMAEMPREEDDDDFKPATKEEVEKMDDMDALDDMDELEKELEDSLEKKQ